MRVKEIMTHKVFTTAPDDSIQKAAQIMQKIDCGSTPVADGDRVVGMITDRDITVKAIAQGKGADTPVKSVMVKNVVSCQPDTDAREAANLMAEHQVRRLPVIDDGKLVGILAIGDLARVNIFVSESGKALSEISEPNRQSKAMH